MFIQTQNVQALPKMTRDQVVHDVVLTASQSDLIGWQEISIDYYRQAVRNLPEDEWDHVAIRQLGNIGGCPISYKAGVFKLHDFGKVKLFNGLPGIGKTRFLVWALLEYKNTGALIMVCNVHYVAKAYSKKRVLRRKLRQKLWRRSNRLLKEFVEESVLKGYMVTILGDFNRMFYLPVGTVVAGHKVHNVTPPGSIDKVILIDSTRYEWANTRLEHKRGVKNSDHKGHNVGAVIKRKVLR